MLVKIILFLCSLVPCLQRVDVFAYDVEMMANQEMNMMNQEPNFIYPGDFFYHKEPQAIFTTCLQIANCVDSHCTSENVARCDKCENNGFLFKPSPSKNKCERVCAWDKQNCWPGECDDDLTRNCRCARGFHKHSGANETSCQLDKTNVPSISKCLTSLFETGGKGKQTKSSKCEEIKDFYGNFQPQQLKFDMAADFKIDISNVTPKAFVKESRFGVTDVTLYILKELISGSLQEVAQNRVLQDNSSGTNCRETFFMKDSMDLNETLKDGERLCVKYEAKGGGYLKTIDLRGSHPIKGPYSYRKTNNSHMFCYRYDNSTPQHCSVDRSCSAGSIKPLEMSSIISKSRNITFDINGWTDPVPKSGNTEHASGIESYQITVHTVSDGHVDSSSIVTKSLNKSQTSASIILPPESPRLYCIKVEVKDLADNIQQTRRFVLYDNSSFISTSTGNASFTVTSATKVKGRRWQTNHREICLNWKSYFTNSKYETNSFLGTIKSDPLIPNKYDQTDGLLPVSGTLNVFGIVEFWFSWSMRNGTTSNEIRVPSVTNQTYCQRLNLSDGQTYILYVKAVDIINNTYLDNRTVHIDRTPPHIENIELSKNGTNRLFVHDQTDLSKMNLSFDALDPHSGVMNIEWWLGTTDAGSDLGHGVFKSKSQDACPKTITKCYCPDIGKCEVYTYSIPLNSLINDSTNIGNHNRNYFFTVRVTNNAGLSNVEQLDILVDDSPPVQGVIYEGFDKFTDIDYTSDNSFVVKWQGFIDHESGIKEYRLGLSSVCVTKETLLSYDSSSIITQYINLPHTESSFRMTANFTGKRYVTIIALNNAMEASDAVCSDGITRDETSPNLKNLRLENGKWSESLYCQNGQAWLFKPDLVKVKLPNNTKCDLRCKVNTPEFDSFSSIPLEEDTGSDDDIEEFICSNLPTFNRSNIIYLPHDQIKLSWEINETGSQIEDYYVGFGRTSHNDSALSVADFKSTNVRQFFNIRHLGVSAGDVFYAYIKTVNKAKLETVTEIGPIMVDETPPLFHEKPTVLIGKSMVTIGWNENTVSDPEQVLPVNHMLFQIVHDTVVASPFFEWRLQDSKSCVTFTGGCVKFPLKRLQMMDTDLGLNFSVRVYAYNNAGHFVTVETDTFKIPSRYPPRHALVIDTDPESISSDLSNDINVHFTPHKLCVRWVGFKHHENITLEIGIGTNNRTANIEPFQPLNDSHKACIKSKSLTFNIRYSVLLRAVCTGGETVSSSNGVTIVNKTQFINHIEINIGENTRKINWVQQKAVKTSQTTLCPLESVTPGQKYKLVLFGIDRRISVQSTTGVVMNNIQYDSKLMNMEIHIVPFAEQPCIAFDVNKTDHVSFVMHADNGRIIISDKKEINVGWTFERFKETLRYFTFQIALAEKTDLLNRSQYNIVTPFMKSDGNSSHTFHIPSMFQNHFYTVIVKPCTNARCIEPIYSDTFEIESNIIPGKLLTLQVELIPDETCVLVKLEWETFKAKSSVTIYQWSVSKDKQANVVLTKWRTIAENDSVLYNVTECVNLPVHGHSTLYLCVRAYSIAGNVITSCDRASVVEKNEYKKDTVYDLDASINTWDYIKEMIHSSNIGSKYSVLHDAEMDFGNSNTSVVGTLMYATERKVSWYLMTNKHLPVLDECDKDTDCIHSATSERGFVSFDKTFIKKNKFYYTCAYSNTSSITRELFTEQLPEIRACSNGFIIDDTPPFGGKVKVKNVGGFLTSLNEIHISWTGFDDNVDTNKIGYAERIKFYSYAIGTRPGSEDIATYTDVGNTQRVVARNLNVDDGNALYVSVKATDHAGLTSEVFSKEMIIDSSPPTTGTIILNGNSRHTQYISSSSINLILEGFKDVESGIDYFDVALGSDNNLQDVQTGLKYTSDHIGLVLPDGMQDGQYYYISAKAVNRAGLSSSTVTTSFVLDRSVPTGGHVLDGDWTNNKDFDYQKDLGFIQGYWKGFTDPHSGIRNYRVGLGTIPGQDNVDTMVDVGLKTDMTWNGTYEIGKKYYVTVQACNGASLCRALSSDGIVLDNSPPIHGIVRVGASGKHQKHLPSGESVHIQWTGFEDPQSGIEHYEFCLGTQPLLCDKSSFLSCLLQSSIIKTGLNLENGIEFFATVKAFNKAGLSVETVSDAFTIDSTPPVLVNKPSFLLGYNAISGLATQWERSVLRLSWKFVDNESTVAFHTVTLKTHHEGHTPIEHIHIGNVNMITIALNEKNWLHNGDKYFVVVTSCNTAGLCTSSQSDSLLIDSSPPHQGGFKPPMTWHNFVDASNKARSNITLKWYGFVDAESLVAEYYIAVSRSYSGHELSGGIISKPGDTRQTEQNATIMLTESLTPDERLILTIWARNSAGLNSSVSRVTVNVLITEKELSQNSSGTLEIQKHSCDIHYCNKDCTCAVFGKPCVTVQTHEKCVVLNASEVHTKDLPKIDVYGGLSSNPKNITSSSACLTAHWVPRENDDIIQRYEWSMGIKDQPHGEGIFDLILERPWRDVGKETEAVHCLSHHTSLEQDTDYQIYVRAWYAWNMFAEFTSHPIHVDQTPPHHTKGKHILDSDVNCFKDFDVIDWMDTISACWDKVFTGQGEISHYIVSMGTSINGSDVFETTNVGLVTNIILSNLSLSHGTRYYFSITAYNSVGLHTTLSSDGFIIDMDKPISGVVFNTDKHTDTKYQSSLTSFGVSWHGFLDRQSGIRSFFVAVVENTLFDYENISFVNVGLNTKHTFKNILLKHGKSYKAVVKASDNVGHLSIVESSSPKIIDATAPQAFDCKHYLTVRPNTKALFAQGSVSFSTIINVNDYYIIRGDLSDGSITTSPTLSINRHQMFLPMTMNNNGSISFQYSFLSRFSGIAIFDISAFQPSSSNNNCSMDVELLKCEMEQGQPGNHGVEVRQLDPSKIAVIIKVIDDESSLRKVRYGAGTSPGGFQVRPLTVLHSDSSVILDTDLQHGTKIYVTVLAENHAGLQSVFKAEPVTIDKTPPKISMIDSKLTEITAGINQSRSTFDLTATWTVDDEESGVKYCLCGLGHVKDLRNYRLSDTKETCTFKQLVLQHGDNVVVTVKCINNVEIAAEMDSEKITITTDAPESARANAHFISFDASNVDTLYITKNQSGEEMPTFLQMDRSQIVLEWEGFEDLAGIDHYKYRLMCQNNTVIYWRNNSKRTMADVKGLDLHSGRHYTAEVAAVNSGNYSSETIVVDMMLQSDDPKLTGKHVSATNRDQRLLLEWGDVFRLTDGIPVTYDVTVGSKRGFSDILELNRIKMNHYEVIVPKTTIVTPSVQELFISITCTYSTGLFTVYQYNYKL